MAVVVAFEVLAETRGLSIAARATSSLEQSAEQSPSIPPREPTLQRRAMALTRLLFPAAVLAWLSSGSASPSLSDRVSQAGTGSTGRRSLLQTKRDCPMDFESQNYTIITSRCKGPQSPPTECCDAFKKFACPFASYINNQSTNCASTMISYINFQGSYPAGMFSAECFKGKEGVSCEGVPGVDTAVPSSGRRAQGSSRHPLVTLLCGIGALLFH
ncbi:GPI-anchored protein LLG1-like isoform X2 [Triticum dicoccoides]|uniref:GPI-anchored protein LLG1-like isoform X2 n=1 Tax=Triticum dicoccoides TaxID=85692 RepID=UPI00188F472C|nr:GPI-anchored protein LLG1-like isoform X2 [Triticum dicoccoides]